MRLTLNRSIPASISGKAAGIGLVFAVLTAHSPMTLAELKWSIQATQVQFLGIEIDRLEMASGHTDDMDAHPGRVVLDDVVHPVTGPVGRIAVTCAVPQRTLGCRSGTVSWTRPDGNHLNGPVTLADRDVQLSLDDFKLVYTRADRAHWLELNQLPMQWAPSLWTRELNLAQLDGDLDGFLAYSESMLDYAVHIDELSFDTADGGFAGAGLALSAHGTIHPADNRLQTSLIWLDGEALLGPLYLPSPERTLEIGFQGSLPSMTEGLSGRIRLHADHAVEINGQLQLAPVTGAEGMSRQQLNADLQIDHLLLDAVWPMGLNSIADAFGFNGVSPGGNVEGRLGISNGSLNSADLVLANIAVQDQQDRFHLDGLNGRIDFAMDRAALDLNLDWRDASLLGIQLGPSNIALHSPEPGTVEIAQVPFRLPVLDGALVLHKLSWNHWLSGPSDIVLDIELTPIRLASLSQAFGWPELGGQLSGRLPGIRFNQGVVVFEGGIDVSAFSGDIGVGNLSIERPFGPLPALAADIELSQLDLFELTGAFDIGSMQGRMSGHMNGLRLLNWQPVAFDAWFSTDAQTSERRRISQQAIDSISSLSGAGGAVLSNTFMQVFDDFPYARVGLGCRLSESVCTMSGLEDNDRGGYLIVEGRGIPNLNIIGYQRRVDWSRLLSQIQSAARGGVAIGDSGGN